MFNKFNTPRKSTNYIVWIFAFIFVAFFVWPISKQLNRNEVQATVIKTERVCDSGNAKCRYLVFTDVGVFENTDSLLNLKFNSSDIYGELASNQKYSFVTTGFRVKILSMYPNIVDYTNVK